MPQADVPRTFTIELSGSWELNTLEMTGTYGDDLTDEEAQKLVREYLETSTVGRFLNEWNLEPTVSVAGVEVS